MPDQIHPAELPQVNLETEPYHFGDQLSDPAALELARSTFNQYSTKRNSNYEARWAENDKLYHGVVKQKYWEGTKVPRAAIGVPLAFDQVESVYPIIINELFNKKPWFQVEATHTSSTAEAQGVQAVLQFQLGAPHPETYTAPVQQLKLAVHETLSHGSGVVQLHYDEAARRIIVERVLLKDFFMDPALESPFVDLSAAVVRRRTLSVAAVEKLRAVPGFNVPSPANLNAFAKSRIGPQNSIQQNADAFRRIDKEGILDPDPTAQTVEILEYWSNDRMIWLINQRWVLTNQPNPFGCKPFVFAPLFVPEGQAYGMSIPDLIEGEQQLVQGIINARLDELSLALHPPRVMDKSAQQSASASEKAWRPGAVLGIDSVKDFQTIQPTNITSDAFTEVGLAERRANRRTGVSDLVQTGTPTPSNANRSATGVASQMQAVNSRLFTIFDNIENYLLVPLLYKTHKILGKFLPEEPLAGVDSAGSPIAVDRAAFNQPTRFIMGAGASMVARTQLQQVFQPVTQILLNEAVHGAAQRQGRVVDFKEYLRFFHDSLGVSNVYTFFREQTEEEAQAAQQPDPKVMAEIQAKQMELKTREKIAEEKNQTEIAVTQATSESKERSTEEQTAGRVLEKLLDGDNKRRAEAAKPTSSGADK